MMNRMHIRPTMRTGLSIILLGVITVVVSSWFFLSMGKFTGGALSMPLDDSYIYFQYARNFAEGRPFHYSSGDVPSTGATSLLYTLLLAAGYKLGARGDSIIAFSFILGSCFLFASSLIVGRILKSLAGGVASIGAAILLLTNGHVVWAYLSGMEVGLFATTILMTLLFFVKERPTGRFYGTSFAAALMGFSRPEGFFLAVPVALLILTTSRDESRAHRLFFALISLSGGFQFLMNWCLTRSFASTGTQVKSVFYTQEPDMWRYYMGRFLQMARPVLYLFLSDFHSSSLSPNWARLATLFLKCGFVAALAIFVFDRRHRNSTALLLVCWGFLAIFLSLVPWAWNVHFNRYQVPFFTIFLVISSVGLGALANLSPGRLRTLAQLALAIIFAATAVSFLGTTKRMARIYAHSCENIFRQQVRVGKWVSRNTPPQTIVGLNDAGAIAYYGERRVFDFVGVVTNQKAINWRSGIGSVVEGLERLPQDDLPRILAIYPNWLPFLVSSGIAKTAVFRAHLDLNIICGGSDKVVYVPDWSLLGSGHALPAFEAPTGLTLVDLLDVADLVSESDHSYRAMGTWRPEARVLTDSLGKQIMDGGRRLFVGETMKVRCSPAKELLVLLRQDSDSATLGIQVDGRSIASATPRMARDGWAYASFRVPAELVRRQPINITMRLTSDPERKGYGSYHYWFLQ
jgi:hypothetical protein